MKKRRVLCLLLALALVLGLGAVPGAIPAAGAAGNAATLTVDLDPAANTGAIIHGAAGFLYGVSSEDVPTTNTIVPLKSKILVTKGALGTEHPYGDALDVAKTFLESGGEQVQMYNSNYYGVFGVTAAPEQYASDLKTYICPAVVAWKDAWKAEHTADGLGQTIDIDEAIVYVPINEGTPAGSDFARSWQLYYDAIKSVDAAANIAGPNSAGYGWQFTAGQSMQSFIQFCADNNCMPDVITWHELETNCLGDMQYHMDDFRDIWYNRTDWSQYNEANGTEGVPEIPQICINEYAEMAYCGVPGRLVNWIARLEDEKITGCLPFWHQANNLNDLAAGANEGNGAWWLYQWYGNMSGTTQPVTTTSSYDQLYGVSTMDEAKKLSTTLLGGWDGDITVRLEHVTATETFAGAACVEVTVEEAMYSGFHTSVTETPAVLRGTYPVNADGSVTLTIPDALFESAYKVTVSQSTATSAALPALTGTAGDVYEAELAQLSGGASATYAASNPSYYMSGSGSRAVDMPSGASLTYTISAPTDGRYRLDFLYGNGQGSVRNDMVAHNPVNAVQTIALDGGTDQRVILESTLFETMTGAKTLYYDLTAGTHTITVTTSEEVPIDAGKLYHDFLRVSYAAAYGEDVTYNRVFEAELADFNKLLNNTDSTVSTQTGLTGYSGSGYVTGLNGRSVEQGGGIRFTVVTEQSGLYNLTLRYQSDASGFANLYVGNTAATLDRLNKTVNLTAGSGWQTVTASIYLQKGINVVDLDATVDAKVDYLRVRELDAQTYSTTIEAENATLSDDVTVAESEGASGGQYVVGMPGSYDPENRQYLEFTYNAPSAGQYQMQVFHSNEDLAGSHTYNIKAIDKYAVVEVNGQSDSPVFELVKPNEDAVLYYFVDCGDHDPATVSAGDSLGTLNSVTDQLYGADAVTGYSWGVVLEAEGEEALDWQGGSQAQSEHDKAVYTTYQRALSNAASDLLDGKAKTETFRYAHSQDTAGNPTVTLSAEGVDAVAQPYTVSGNAVQTMTIDLTGATTNSGGRVELSVKATSQDATLQMNYICIASHQEDKPATVTLPGGVEVLAGQLPEDVYVGELAPNDNTLIDYRNLKNSTDRYFFINTFSDDTFREKTITLNLQQGRNTIRIYNDNSWNVTYGGTQATPGLTELPNYTPNFDKFVITPMALDTPAAQAAQYRVTVSTTGSGAAFSNKTLVDENGAYTLTILSEGEAPTVYVNGEQKTAVQQADGTYTLTVTNVTADQQVEVYFLLSKATVQALYDELEALEPGDYTSTSYALAAEAMAQAEAVLAQTAPTATALQAVYEALQAAKASLAPAIEGLTYFVDCGDHDPATVTGTADDFGSHNSVTDQLYGADAVTGYSWGVVLETEGEEELGYTGGSQVQSEHDKAVYTTYQRALSNAAGDLADGQDKTATFRYAHGQDSAGIDPRYVSYAFELEPGQYEITVCMGARSDWQNNSKHPLVTLSAAGVEDVSKQYDVPDGGNQTETLPVDLTEAAVNAQGRVELSVKATSQDATIQMNYITIIRTDSEPEEPVPEETYTVTVYNSYSAQSGSGDYCEGDLVMIHAGSRDGYRFAGWYSDDVTLTDEADATFTMPARDVLVEALWSKITTPGGGTHVTPEEEPETPVQTAFEDVEATDWYYEAVTYVAETGLMTGVGGGKFDPDGAVTRAMVWTVLARMDGVETEGGAVWYSRAQAWAMETGVSDGTDPMGSITREQLATMLYRFTGSPTVGGSLSAYPDAASVSTWAADALTWATQTGLINGINGSLRPQTGATRAQLATMLMRMREI